MSLSDMFEKDEARSVSELTRQIKFLLESNLPACWIQGEVSNFRRQSSGHLYFTLKDDKSQIPAVMFRGSAAGLDFRPEDGMEVKVYGEVNVYEPYGRYQLLVRAMTKGGAGDLARRFDQLKKKLLEEGLFEKDRKKSLPILPQAIAFVTSPTGAAVQDFIRILKRRNWGGSLTVLPAKVQGKGAADEIVEALSWADNRGAFDLVTLGRGGGSLEDLWCFNEEMVARKIAALETPVISAVGHEVDFTLSDFVADVRAETPSGAAEMIAALFDDSINRVDDARENLHSVVDNWIQWGNEQIAIFRQRLRSASPSRKVENASLRLDELSSRLSERVGRLLDSKRQQLSHVHRSFDRIRLDNQLQILSQRLRRNGEKLEATLSHATDEKHRKLELLRSRLAGLNPKAVLGRGYALLSQKNGGLISSTKEVPDGESIRATLKDGDIWLSKEDEPSS